MPVIDGNIENISKWINLDDGKSSFYGVHKNSLHNMDPKVMLDVPINDLYGSHLAFGKTESVAEDRAKQK